jgi:hypothetical protein
MTPKPLTAMDSRLVGANRTVRQAIARPQETLSPQPFAPTGSRRSHQAAAVRGARGAI